MTHEAIFASSSTGTQPTESDPLLAGRSGKTSDASKVKFRYIVCGLLVLGTFIKNYERHVLAVASIKMVSSDVGASELTDFRAEVLASQLFDSSASSNAGLPGTCPLIVLSRNSSRTESTTRPIARLNVTRSPYSQSEIREGVTGIVRSLYRRLDQGKLVNWTTQQRGFILAAQPVGSLLAALPLSRLGLVIGNKNIVTLAFAFCTIHALLLPTIVVELPFWLIIVCELIFGGISDGATAVLNPFFSNWLTPPETGAFIVVYMFGMSAGSSSNSFLSTQLLAANVPWVWCMYLPGILMLFNLCAWSMLATEKPNENNHVSREEKSYLRENSTVQLARKEEISSVRGMMESSCNMHQCVCKQTEEDSNCDALRLVRTPIWKNFFTSPSIYAQIFASFAYFWKTELWSLWPTFFANILHLEPSAIGIMISLKVFVAVIYGVVFARFARKFEERIPFGWSLITYVRVGYSLAALVGITSSLIMAIFDCSPTAMVFAVLLTPMLNGFVSISYLRLPVDQSPEDSGIIASYVRLLSPGDTLAIPVSSYILSLASGNAVIGNRQTWRIVWLLAVGIDTVAAIVFLIFARTDRKVYSKVSQRGPCKSRSMPVLPVIESQFREMVHGIRASPVSKVP